MKAAGECSSVRAMADRTSGAKNRRRLLFGLRLSRLSRIVSGMIPRAFRMYMLQVEERADPEGPFTREMRIHARERRRTSLRRKGTEGNSGGAGEAFAASETLARSDGTETSYPTCQVGGRLTFSTTPDPAVREERLRPWTGSGILVEAAAAVTGSGNVGVAKREARQGRTKLG